MGKCAELNDTNIGEVCGCGFEIGRAHHSFKSQVGNLSPQFCIGRPSADLCVTHSPHVGPPGKKEQDKEQAQINATDS